MKRTPEQELKDIKKTLGMFWTLINNEENVGIYTTAYFHGVRLSDKYVKEIEPINKKIKKFLGIKS